MKKFPLLSIFLIVLVDLLGLTIILPLLPFYAESMGATPAVVGLLVSTYAVCQLIAGPPLGQLSDRVGRKPVLLVSQLGTLAGFLTLGFAHSLWLVFIARVVDGLTAGNLTVAQAYISDVTAPAERAKAFGIIGMAFGIGFLFGPAMSGYLAQFGISYPIFTAAGLSALSIMATFFLLPDAVPDSDPERKPGRRWAAYAESLRDAEIAPRLWQFFASQFAISIFFSGFALFAERRLAYKGVSFGPREVGYIFAYLGLVGILFQGAIGPLVKKFGEARLVQIGFVLMGCSLILVSRVRFLAYLLIAMTLFACGTSLLRPNLTSLISQKTSRHRQGMAIGLMQSLMSLAQIAAPVLGGMLIEKQLLEGWALAGVAVSGIGMLLVVFPRVQPAVETNL